MSGQVESAFVTVDIVIPRLSPSGSGWEVVLIQRKKEPYKGLWALPSGHLTTEDVSFLEQMNHLQLEFPGIGLLLSHRISPHMHAFHPAHS